MLGSFSYLVSVSVLLVMLQFSIVSKCWISVFPAWPTVRDLYRWLLWQLWGAMWIAWLYWMDQLCWRKEILRCSVGYLQKFIRL